MRRLPNEMRRVQREQWLDGGADPFRERDFDEDERLMRQRGMEKREAAPVGGEPAAQIVPSGDFVNRFVLDQFLENDRRRIPVDALKCEKAPIEPGPEEMLEVGLDAF